MDDILDVDLLAFERGSASERAAVVDGVKRSLATGFVYTKHDVGEGFLDSAYGMLADFFSRPTEEKSAFHVPESHGQTGYTGLLVETAASADVADWKEMLNWGAPLGEHHPLRARYPFRYGDPVLPESSVPGIHDTLLSFHHQIFEIQRRFLRIIALGLGCDEYFFDEMLTDGPTLTRAIRYPPMPEAPSGQHVWAAAHDDINLITALPRATAKGLQVRVDDAWADVAPPDEHMIINTGMMLERLTNGAIPPGTHQVVGDPEEPGERLSVVQFCHPTPWTLLTPVASCVTSDNPQRFGGISAGDALEKVLWEINLIAD
ncbi:MAG: isopenicillin N synthase family oxygenase [Acidimicrobiales bacterium]|nr:isopenicillin N synthase family oxygenase [Acidimicrobiales bacterium]RZV44614.1 MAG: isopenicillin N synthase family oxygenase [Acidimicrobiales bacterium]